MPYLIDTVNGHLDLIHTITTFAAGWPQRGAITSTLVGNPEMKYVRSVISTAPLETWTVVCTTAGADGVAIFSVTGSTSGAQANATAGVSYDNGICRFKIVGPALYNCVLGDQFQFTFAVGDMTTAGIAWVIERYLNQYASDAESILRGEGTGSDEIFIGYKSQQNIGSDIYNVGLQGYTAYSAVDLWEEQPGAIPMTGFNGVSTTNFWCPMIGFSKEPQEARLYLSANSRRISGCIFFEGYSGPFYSGFLLPYFTPNQWPYPLMIGGSMGGDEDFLRYSNTNAYNSSWFFPLVTDNNYGTQPDNMSSCRILDPGTGWRGLKNWYNRSFSDENMPTQGATYNGVTWPYVARCFEDVQKNIDGSYPLFPIYLWSPGTTVDCPDSYIYGVPDGCFAISGFDNAQENDFTIGGDVYIVVRNSQYSSVWDNMAIRMDS